MTADIVILSEDPFRLEKCLESIYCRAAEDSVGRVVVGWKGYWPEDFRGTEKEIDPFADGVLLSRITGKCDPEARNFLVRRYCASESVLFMNDGVELSEDSVTKCVEWLQNPAVGTVGAKLLSPDGKIRHAGVYIAVKDGKCVECADIINGQGEEMSHASMVASNSVEFMALRRADFWLAGGFNEKYKTRFEDVELNVKLLNLGKANICDCSTRATIEENRPLKPDIDDQYRIRHFIEECGKIDCG